MANFMRSKIFLSVVFISLAAFIIGGVTMAWFTDDAGIEAAEFKAGTVKINADKEPKIFVPEGKSFDNVNPGDCATIVWEFENTGTKAVQLKVKLNELWSDDDLDIDSVFYCPVDMKDGKGWVMADDEEGNVWLYYINKSTGELASVPGTYNAENPDEPLTPEKVELKLVVVFDAEDIDNEYQGETYTLGGEGSQICAIQASNNAPDSQWDEWTEVIRDDYVPEDGTNAGDNYAYFHTGPGSLSDCWLIANGKNPLQDPDKLYVTISYLPNGVHYQEWEQWDENEPVKLTAPDIQGYEFDGWDVPSELGASQSGRNLEFVMPDHDVGVTAKYTQVIQNRTVTINYDPSSLGSQETVPRDVGQLFEKTADKQIEKGGKIYKFDKWLVPSGLNETYSKGGRKIAFQMPDNDVTITAKYKEIAIASFEIKDVEAEGHGSSGFDPDRYTTVTGTINNLKDTDGDKVSGSLSVKIVAKVKRVALGSVTQEFNVTLNFNENGKADFSVDVEGVRNGDDDDTTVTITIGGVTKTKQGD